MAVTRLIAMHASPGKSVLQSLRQRTNYVKNPEKTEDGELISAYACAPESVAEEFALAQREYCQHTGRHPNNEVIGYQLRQSFAPGEVTPQEANQIGYELASRFLKGQHAFIVATHTDRSHIHNHIVFCATSLDYERKFRNFLGSGKALGRLSDLICMEHRLSVITHPQHKGLPYIKSAAYKERTSTRDLLRMAIDDALLKKPEGLDALIALLGDAGWEIKPGKQFSFRAPNGQRFIRMDTLGDEYSEEALCAVLAGHKIHPIREKLILIRRSPPC